MNRKKILLLDDDEEIRQMLNDGLSFLPRIEILEAGSGATGAALVIQEQIDLLITDLFMPDQDGIDTILEVKKTRPRIKIIAISGLQTKLYQAKVFGVDSTFTKPFDVMMVEEEVKRLLEIE